MRLIAVENKSREGCAEHEDQKPQHAVFPQGEYARFQIGFVGGGDSRHLRDIFGVLVLQDVHGVVDGDDPDESHFAIDDGERQKAVIGNRPCNDFLVLFGVSVDDVVVHDLFDECRLLREHEVLGGDQPQQLVGGVDDVAGVDGFLIDRGAANTLEGVFHRHVGTERHELDRHDAAGAVFRVAQNLVDIGARLHVALREQTFDHACRHLFEQVDGIVEEELVEHGFELPIVQLADQSCRYVRVHFHEGLRRKVFGEQAEEDQKIGIAFRLLEYLGKVDGVHRGEQGFQDGIVALF